MSHAKFPSTEKVRIEKFLIQISETYIKEAINFLQEGKTMDFLFNIRLGLSDLSSYEYDPKTRNAIQILDTARKIILKEKRISLKEVEMIIENYPTYPKEMQKLMMILLAVFFDFAPLDEKVILLEKIQKRDDSLLLQLFL